MLSLGPDTQGEALSTFLLVWGRQWSRREGGKQIHTTAAVSTSYFETRCKNNRLRGRGALVSRAKAGWRLAEQMQQCSCSEILPSHHSNGSYLSEGGSSPFFFFLRFLIYTAAFTVSESL